MEFKDRFNNEIADSSSEPDNDRWGWITEAIENSHQDGILHNLSEGIGEIKGNLTKLMNSAIDARIEHRIANPLSDPSSNQDSDIGNGDIALQNNFNEESEGLSLSRLIDGIHEALLSCLDRVIEAKLDKCPEFTLENNSIKIDDLSTTNNLSPFNHTP